MKTISDGPVGTFNGIPVYADERVRVGQTVIFGQNKIFQRIYMDLNSKGEIKMESEERKTTIGDCNDAIREFTLSDPKCNGILTNITASTPRWHTVHIDKVDNGFIVKIGCKTFVETYWNTDRDHEGLAQKLFQYFDDPIAAEKKYCK